MKFYNTEIGRFCAEHSNYEELLSASPYFVKTKRTVIENKTYVMFCYSQIESDFSNCIVRECRGIIFREGEWSKPVCHAFDKFGNYGEEYVPNIDWASAKVTEKIDGSLIKVWWNSDTHKYVVSTNGSISAFDALIEDVRYKSFGELFCDAVNITEFLDVLNKHMKSTYLFELVSPVNRVVIPYEKLQLYFLGERDFNGILTSFVDSDCTEDFKSIGIEIPQIYPLHNLADCVSAASQLPWDEEGYVVHDRYQNRVKIKSPAYVVAHYARMNGNVTVSRLIDVILAGETSEFLVYCSDYKEAIEEIKNKMTLFREALKSAIQDIEQKTHSDGLISRKDFAALVKEYPTYVQPYLFLNYDKSVSVEDYLKEWNTRKWGKVIDLL